MKKVFVSFAVVPIPAEAESVEQYEKIEEKGDQ